MPPMPNDEYSSQLIEIIERMICRNPDERPSATELLQDVVFKNQRALKVRHRIDNAECFQLNHRNKKSIVKFWDFF